MASQAAYMVEKAVGHGKENIKQDVSKYEGVDDPNETMKALVWQGKQKVEVVEVPKPKILEDQDVILKVTGTTVCGSDLHLLHGAIIQLSKGDILGHEFCGVVDQVGPAVKNIKVGKRYVAAFQITCGECEKTNSNTTAKAMYGSRTAGLFGYSHFTGGFAGGQAEYVRVPIADANLLEIPDALYLSDVLPTAYNAVKDTAVYPGDQVAIFGAGPIGQMAGVFALGEGASKVIAIDTEPRLSAISQRWPAEHKDKLQVLDYKKLSFGITNKETVVSKLKELCGGRGPDVAIECAAGEYAKGWMHWLEMSLGAETDTSEILNEMIEGVRNYGRAGITGVYVGYDKTNHLNVGSLMQRGIRLIGNGQAPVMKYWEGLLSKIQQGELDPTQMLSHRFRIDDIDKVYYKFDSKEDNIQKVFVETKFSFPRAEGTPELTTL
ncbi:hypothetical protein CHGG_08365 [Chaetomium globosum CBS 148.51]|uniref:Alcohol dehydrogenase-like N-terminal domain-containing protein n=1 Tax=Chaetomium globosum (strain ATCC 6205 / CBS 148.51 / DSM 1962 / NBRC 6347 / NRRL 1970) TaxID=306901 RepID=Q2GUI9_CHAGB|nr:uncharacterized protein CHGG_08365 [Chaetomium globosum CBS 148.51]EAQ84351.1 hypothetical protein CHGG_08365 [Chaetomium globosum CBS 148.51]